MAKQGRSTVVPRLRFPEFRKATKWAETTLGSEATFQKGRGISKAEIDPKGNRLCIRYGELYTRYGEVIREVFSRTNAPESGLLLSCKNDVIVPASGETKDDIATASCVLLDDVALGSDLNVIRTRHNGVFLSYFLNGPKRREVAKVAQGDTVVHLYSSQLGQLPIAFPEKGEQQKIADCLTALDEVIAAYGQRVAGLMTYKRGLMQQLFPREGETIPRLRFPEFRNDPEWKEVKAGTLFANRSERGEDALPIYSVTMTDGLVKRTSLDRRIDDLAEAAGNKKVLRHDIAYNMMRMWQGACGVARVDCMVSPAYVVLAPKMGVRSDFYGYLFKLPQMLRLFTAHSRGLTEDRLRLYYQGFSSIPLPQPDVREQRQIADFLSALDTRIAIESDKLDALKTHKQGLMQQLFPSPEVV
ncbi:MAG: restriction endonuclease subunit S [Burkholderiales bacterium]|nr:restriction endonuclease subunit S [Burkholderiales bacterium]